MSCIGSSGVPFRSSVITRISLSSRMLGREPTGEEEKDRILVKNLPAGVC
jgi:hypothetical protein